MRDEAVTFDVAAATPEVDMIPVGAVVDDVSALPGGGSGGGATALDDRLRFFGVLDEGLSIVGDMASLLPLDNDDDDDDDAEEEEEDGVPMTPVWTWAAPG